jgi:excisionase family DNA binding protein
MSDDRMMTIQEVADYLRFSPHLVRSYIRRKYLKGTKVGVGKNCGWRVYRDDMIAFVNRNNDNK